MSEFFRAAFVIGRRDFTATVYSKSFLLFLLSPLMIVAFSVLVSGVMSNAAQEDIRTDVAVVAAKADFEAMDGARERLSPAFGGRGLPSFTWFAPERDSPAQVKQLLGSEEKGIVAVLTGGLAAPVLTGAVGADGTMKKQVALVIDEARESQAAAAAGVRVEPADVRVVRVDRSAGSLATVRALTARIGQLYLFFLTVLLSGMLLSNMLEEKSNKVIEVLAAAVPVDAIFLGKIISMLAISLIGVAVWGGGALSAALAWGHGGAALPEPAVGWPFFILMMFVYFSANYLLLGALFLGIGSQASSVREVQTLSMPITIGQMLIFAFASLAASHLDKPVGIAAAVFPFSSPLTMIARAAEAPAIWPHLLAIVWQGLWVMLTVKLGAMLFRRNVLKSGAGGAKSA